MLLADVYLLTHSLTHSCPLCRLACRAATKVLHPCLFWASFWTVPQVWWRVLSSPSTIRCQVFLGCLRFCFPSGVQWRAVREMLPGSLLITFPIHLHCLCMMMVLMLSWLQRAKRCWLEMVLGQNMCRILWRFLVWKVDSNTVGWGRLQSSSSILSRTVRLKVRCTQAAY